MTPLAMTPCPFYIECHIQVVVAGVVATNAVFELILFN